MVKVRIYGKVCTYRGGQWYSSENELAGLLNAIARQSDMHLSPHTPELMAVRRVMAAMGETDGPILYDDSRAGLEDNSDSPAIIY